MKEAITRLVKASGKRGITAMHIAVILGVDPSVIYNWFFANDKKVKEIKKIGPAKYAWVG